MSTIASDAPVPVSAQEDRYGRAMWVYEIRPIVTAADREAAAALVQDRNLWLSRHGHDASALHVTAFRDHRTEAVGLYEEDGGDEILVGCLLLHRQPAPQSWGVDNSALTVLLAHTAPGRTDRPGWLLTMWLADYAARAGSEWVHAEVPGWNTGSNDGVARLLGHLRDLGWQVLGTGHDPDGHRVTRIRLAAAASPGLTAMIHCTVPLHSAAPRSEPEEGSTR
ncbi:hypothetical protein ACFWXE_15450 [[Kitasatospora] papulosa]|uniref:hypothetical protein n=1 Tax=[Kitasatospora] papulosa TaxID=1464011 RepID=UPI0036BDCED5